jgi:hypothetical protein
MISIGTVARKVDYRISDKMCAKFSHNIIDHIILSQLKNEVNKISMIHDKVDKFLDEDLENYFVGLNRDD